MQLNRQIKITLYQALVLLMVILASGVSLGAESAAIRQRVLGNIRASKAGRTESNIANFAIYDAKESQIIAGYNADAWTIANLQKGDIVYGGLPGQSTYYTTEKTLIESGYSREKLFQSLQVKPDPVRGYRPTVGVYEVTQDMRVPGGIINANPHLGTGGGEQFLIKNFGSSLRLTKTIELGEGYEFMPSYRSGY